MVGQKLVANSVAEFLGIAAEFTSRWFIKEKNWGPWFRGHGDERWELMPKLYRNHPPKRGIRIVEDELRQEFTMRAPSLTSELPKNSWEWYFLMQHHGAPTRLLDWTESALIALYFAVREKRDKSDAAVWVLEPWLLNGAVLGVEEVIPPGLGEGLFKADVDRYKDWLPNRYEISGDLRKELPVAIYPTHFSRRISSQRSCFTIHGSRPDGFDRLPDEALAGLAKIIIPVATVGQVEDDLAVAGIDELTIFPDLDGLGRLLAMTLRDEARH